MGAFLLAETLWDSDPGGNRNERMSGGYRGKAVSELRLRRFAKQINGSEAFSFSWTQGGAFYLYGGFVPRKQNTS